MLYIFISLGIFYIMLWHLFKADISALNLSENAKGEKNPLAFGATEAETLRGTTTQVSDGNQGFFSFF